MKESVRFGAPRMVMTLPRAVNGGGLCLCSLDHRTGPVVLDRCQGCAGQTAYAKLDPSGPGLIESGADL